MSSSEHLTRVKTYLIESGDIYPWVLFVLTALTDVFIANLCFNQIKKEFELEHGSEFSQSKKNLSVLLSTMIVILCASLWCLCLALMLFGLLFLEWVGVPKF
jgi:sterol desaturase/sphingolipid hydroxylase (fatty acid hydroxylase superfamily)